MPGATSVKVVRSISKDEKIKETGLDDIEESPSASYTDDAPTPTQDEHGNNAGESAKPQERLFTMTNKRCPQKETGECCASQNQVHLIDVSDDSPGNQPKKIRDALKSPKSYFFDNIQRRREKSLVKSQSAQKFMSAGPNLLRRNAESSCEERKFEDRFTSIEKANAEEASLVTVEKKRMWSSNANRYRIDRPAAVPSFNWAYNLQQHSRFRDFPSKSKSCHEIAGKKQGHPPAD